MFYPEEIAAPNAKMGITLTCSRNTKKAIMSGIGD